MKNIIKILIISLLPTLSLAQITANDFYTSAIQYYNKGDYSLSEKYFDVAIYRKYSPLYDAYIYRGNTLMNQQKYKEAYTDFNQAVLELNNLGYTTIGSMPENVKASFAVTLFNRGLSYFYQGNYSLAAGDFQYTLKYNPQFNAANHWLGNTEYALKSYENAANYFTKAILSNMNDVYLAYHNRACCYIYLGKLTEAKADMEMARQKKSPPHWQWAVYGLLQWKTGKYQEAIDAFDKLLAVEPNHMEILLLKKECLEKLKVIKKEQVVNTDLPLILWETPKDAISSIEGNTIQLKACIGSKAKPEITLLMNDQPYQSRDFKIVPAKTTLFCEYDFQQTVVLGNLTSAKFTLRVKNSSGQVESERTVNVAQQVTNNQSLTKEKRLALVIGVSNYDKKEAFLENPINDARDIAKTLRLLNFEVLEYKDLSRKEMRKAIDDFGEKLKNYNVGLFFYAGHGMQTNGENYLLPKDADMATVNDVPEECVAVNRLLGLMDVAQSDVNIVILDACRNNPFERSWSRSMGKTGGLASPNAPKGTLVAYSADANQTADDKNPDSKNGLYTGELLKNITKPGLTLEQVLKQTRIGVLQKSNNSQMPAEYNKMVGDFYFVK